MNKKEVLKTFGNYLDEVEKTGKIEGVCAVAITDKKHVSRHRNIKCDSISLLALHLGLKHEAKELYDLVENDSKINPPKERM